jgi:putative redox protein
MLRWCTARIRPRIEPCKLGVSIPNLSGNKLPWSIRQCCGAAVKSADDIHRKPPDPTGEQKMECTIKWLDGMSFIAETGTGHIVAMDGAPEAGGRNLAPRPMELLLAGAGGCTAFDVVLILKRSRQDVRGCTVRLEAERAETDPKVFTRIAFIYTITGKNLKRETVERAIHLSAEKYCSASIMLGKTAEMTHTCEIVEVD